MKIILMITGLGMGGAERQVCDLADKFSEFNHQVILLSLTDDVVNRPKSTKVKVVPLGMRKSLSGFIKAYCKTKKIIEDFKPDVIHSHMVHANIFARILRLTSAMKKLICTAHNTSEGGRIRMFIYRVTDALCDVSTNVSQEAVDAFIAKGAVPMGRMLAIHNGIDIDLFNFHASKRDLLRATLSLPNSKRILLAVGRLNIQKDYPNLLLAFSLLTKQSPSYGDAELVIIGAGEEQEKISEMVTELRLSSRVHFLGLQHNVHEWLSAADVFVLSSAWEGFGLVVAEAMACKRVVVATDCGGVKEVLGECGFLVPPKNSQALADGLSAALSLTSEEARVKGELARQRVIERYSLQEQAKRWLELYQR